MEIVTLLVSEPATSCASPATSNVETWLAPPMTIGDAAWYRRVPAPDPVWFVLEVDPPDVVIAGPVICVIAGTMLSAPVPVTTNVAMIWKMPLPVGTIRAAAIVVNEALPTTAFGAATSPIE